MYLNQIEEAIMEWKRSCGVLMHPTSLPSPYGIGDFGPEAYQFIQFLQNNGQHYWQMLPLSYPGAGNSPYSPLSAFAGSPWLISPDILLENNWLHKEDLDDYPLLPTHRVEYGQVMIAKLALIRQAFTYLPSHPEAEAFTRFCAEEKDWLDDFSFFAALKQHYDDLPWFEWPEPAKLRDKAFLESAQQNLSEEIRFQQFIQYLFWNQWHQLHQYAKEAGIQIVGDLPIYVSYDCADVWAHKELFQMEADGTRKAVAGVPPDMFSEDGQLWGNPLYDWDKHAQTGYQWWIKRVKHSFRLADIVRIDHFIGFVRYWSVPATDTTARNGHWVYGPAEHFFSSLTNALGELPIIAEDLGVVTPEVIALKERFNYPGMVILQFNFYNDALPPEQFPPHSFIYTGTHDNNTTRGWYPDWLETRPEEIANINTYLSRMYHREDWNPYRSDVNHITRDLIEAAYASPCVAAVIPMQDLLDLDADCKMNLPGTAEGNWEWRNIHGYDKVIVDLIQLKRKHFR